MNLFVIAWGWPGMEPENVVDAMEQMNRLYPQLEADTLFCEGDPCKRWLVASLQHGGDTATPRQYVSYSHSHLTLFDGLPIHPQNSFAAHRATELDRHWEDLPNVLEGQFLAARISLGQSPELEIVTDPLGTAQFYSFDSHRGWLLSNSVRLIQLLSGAEDPDHIGLSLYLATDWVWGDRTLIQDIRVIPGGQRWRWVYKEEKPHKHSYFEPSYLIPSTFPSSAGQMQKLAKDLIPMFQTLSSNFESLSCLLTGGRDSRLIAALASAAGVPFSSRTIGDPSSSDVRIARRVSKELGIIHNFLPLTTHDLSEQWQVAARRLVDQNDGMVSLWQIGDVLRQPHSVHKLEILFSGTGGEIARVWREKRLPKPEFLHNLSATRKSTYEKIVPDYRALICPETTEATKTYLDQFIDGCVSSGFSQMDITHVFYAFERVRRWGGSNSRKSQPIADAFRPFCTRPYLFASFAMSATERYFESLHFQLMHMLQPDLHSLPFAKRSWSPQTVPAYLWWRARKISFSRLFYAAASRIASTAPKPRHRVKKALDQASLFEAEREHLRDYCLSHRNSTIWQLADRSQFERLMSSDAEPTERNKCLARLYTIATLFYYFHPD